MLRVLQAGDGLRLGVEACQVVGAGVTAAEDHLQGDEAVEALPRLVDDAHAAATQFAEEDVTVRRTSAVVLAEVASAPPIIASARALAASDGRVSSCGRCVE